MKCSSLQDSGRTAGNRRNALAVFSAFVLFFFLDLPPAESQAVASLSRVEHIRTESFDIYFPSSLADQGERIATFADDTLAELEAFFGAEVPGGRIPLLLSDTELDLNGYATPYPSNRIVIYPRGAGPSGQLASFGDELRSVFVHELVHVVTLNMRSKFWSALSAAAGDFLAPVSWIVPNAFMEGTAVWMESRYGEAGTEAGTSPAAAGGAVATRNALPGSGRLHDPAALETVYLDIIQGRLRGLWDVSGVADHPGSGNLPYLYGALFARFMEERYGSGSLAALWRLSSAGNLFAGFDGTLTSGGALERYTGQPPAALWEEFLDWLGRQATRETGPEDQPIGAIVGAAGGRIGAFCADERRLCYLDLERKAVFALDLDNAAGSAMKAEPFGAGFSRKPTRLFPGDGYIENMRLAAGGGALEIDWVRTGPKGRLVPARYSYDFERGTLSLIGDCEIEKVGAATVNLRSGSPLPFLYGAQLDLVSGYRYGLVRMGTRTMPARLSPDEGMEILESPLLFIRSLSLGSNFSLAAGEIEGKIIALGATIPGGLSRIVLLEENADGWKFFLQGKAPEGGVFFPVFAGRTRLVYRAELGEGRQILRMVPVSRMEPDAFSEGIDVTWRPLETMRAVLAAGTKPDEVESSSVAYASLNPALFPRLSATSRYPYVEAESVGLVIEGSDLTERLAWKTAAGWNFIAAVPEASVTLGLAVDTQDFFLTMSDSTDAGTGTATPVRIMGASFGHRWSHSLLPLRGRFDTAASAHFAGLQTDYSIAGYPSPDFEYVSVGSSLRAGYSTMRSLPFSPFDGQGSSFTGGLDYELLPAASSAFSFSGSLSLALPRPATILSLYGAFSPKSDLRFRPAGRHFSVDGNDHPSAIAIPYPEYKEYRGMEEGSSWYCFGELEARLATIELWKTLGPVRMPWLPSWTVRRISFRGGMRAAILEQAGVPVLPYSAFARMEIDAALLAGLAAEGHIALNIEASWAFVPSLADGQAFHFDFGFGVSL